MTSLVEKYKVNVPEGQSGIWKVERMTITKKDVKLSNLRAAFRPGARYIDPGIYTQLLRGHTLVMSDTTAEILDHTDFINRACGDVLIHGLGLGVVLQGCFGNSFVKHVTVVEKSPEVIELVGPHYQDRYGDRLEIIEGDAFTWKPARGQRWTCAWHDIWDNICTSNLPEMTKLHRRFGRRVDWQGSWARGLCRRYA